MVPLRSIEACFQGAIPAVIATCSADGEPNITHLSQVYLIDDEHVGVSNQFFTKTANNLADNPVASILVVEPSGCESYQLLVHYERRDTDGPLYHEARHSVEAIAALTGMAGVFEVRAVDVFRVLNCARVPNELRPDP
ncbi:MAG: Adenylate cyclase [Acidimicrobiia bacterium]|nr:Adenylate cyclase [Acidimicrobiia bacterium]